MFRKQLLSNRELQHSKQHCFSIPQVVCFRGDLISMVIAWIVIKVKYISLVNLITDMKL